LPEEDTEDAKMEESPILVEGERKGSQFYSYKGKLYKRESFNSLVTVVKCKHFATCPARGKIVEGKMIFTNPHHKCVVEEKVIKRQNKISRMKELAETTSLEISAIYELCVEGDYEGIPIETIRSTLQSRRAKFIPHGVSSPEQVVQFFEENRGNPDCPYARYYLDTVSYTPDAGT
jgi:hypothetical protein